MSACGLLQAVHHDLEDVAGMGWAPASDESQCSQQCSEFGFSTWQCFATEFEAFWLVCLSWQGVQPRLAASPSSPLRGYGNLPDISTPHFSTRWKCCAPPWYILRAIPKLLVVVMGCYSMVWVSQIPGLENPMWNLRSGGHLRWGDWIPLSTLQMECVGIASPSLWASGATINNNSNQHLHFSALLKTEVNLNSPYHKNRWFFFSPFSCWFSNISVQWSVRSYS